jgi:hypothetical protein
MWTVLLEIQMLYGIVAVDHGASFISTIRGWEEHAKVRLNSLKITFYFHKPA